MKITIIIPVKPGIQPRAVERLQSLPQDEETEILVAEGTSPSRQRNAAVAEASGDILYFLDDDSLVQEDALRRVRDHFRDPAVAAVGGPSVAPAHAPLLQRAFAAVFCSRFGGGSVRTRYCAYGDVRKTGENELILCNLAFRKDVFLAAGGFDERLYPNEENELMDRIIASGHVLLHDPRLAVTRSHRHTLRAFTRQLFTYGRGRGEQTRISGKVNFVSFIPMLFLLYLVLLPLVVPVAPVAAVPGLLYLVLLVLFSTAAAVSGGLLLLPLLFFLFPLFHLAYGAGSLLGLLFPRFRKEKRHSPVTVRKYRVLQQD